MRLWSIHPKYLDTKGLVALWREGLLAQKVLEGKTKGYRNHPQLLRFERKKDPVQAIGIYLFQIAKEARQRGYSFDATKIKMKRSNSIVGNVSFAQIEFEFQHLKRELSKRSPRKLREIRTVRDIETHPSFRAVQGAIEEWERGNVPSRR